MTNADQLHFSSVFPKHVTAICRLSVCFFSKSRFGSLEVVEESKRRLADAAAGLGGNSILDFRCELAAPTAQSRQFVRWWKASGVLSITALHGTHDQIATGILRET